MPRALLLAGVVGLAWAGVALADVPLPPDLKYVTPKVRFEGVEKQTDYAFFLRYNAGAGNPYAAPPRIVEVKNGQTFEMDGGRRIVNVQLFAVPRADVAGLREKDPTGWLNDKTPGVIKANVELPSTVIPRKLDEVPVTIYRVILEEKKLKVEKVPEDKKSREAPRERLPQVMVGLAISLSLATLGLWFVRRRGVAI